MTQNRSSHKQKLTLAEKKKRGQMRVEIAGENNEKMWAFLRDATELFGATAGIFCTHLLFLEGHGVDPDGYIWKTRSEWRAERGLKRHEVEKGRKVLEARGVLEVVHRSGVPPRDWYRLNLSKLAELIDELEAKRETPKQEPPREDTVSLEAAQELEQRVYGQESEPEPEPAPEPEPEEVKPEIPPDEWERLRRELDEVEDASWGQWHALWEAFGQKHKLTREQRAYFIGKTLNAQRREIEESGPKW